jgi:hypothetical protein
VDQSRFADRHTLVIGNNYSAATNVVALAELTHQYPSTRVTWLTRGADPHVPISLFEDDPLPARAALARTANALAAGASNAINHFAATSVEQIAYDSASTWLQVALAGQHARVVQVDRIIANVGYRPDRTIYSELHVRNIDDPNKLLDCTAGPDALRNPEPNFYILGAKSYGCRSQFLISHGLQQIRDLFTIIGGRSNLDLYHQPRPKR